ncbi:MAG TPA: DUF4272 domain-containing protein [Longimicrobium sp.]|jgi:hypothetical protein
MTAEPINLFARIADHAGVARRLRELAPDVKIDGPDDRWRSARVSFGKWWRKRTLTLLYDPDYHAEPNWSAQMGGMRGYLSRFPDSGRKRQAVMLPTTFRYSLATQFDPDPDPGGDPRLDVLFAVAELVDGVLFTPSALRDARGRVLFSPEGAGAEDPAAVWPRVIAEVSVSDPSGAAAPDDEDEDAEPPTAERVARRALALAAVTARAILEREARERGAAGKHQDLLGWVRETGVEDELEEYEREHLRQPPGRLDPRSQMNASWRLEGLAVLAWALGRFELPPHDELVDPDPLWKSLGLLDAGAARALLASPALRPREEIEALRSRLFALHWRLRDFYVKPGAMDFGEFARTCWFGPLDLTGIPLVEGDLGLGGRRIDRAPPDVFSTAHSAAQERHQAANWLWEGPALYSEASVAT